MTETTIHWDVDNAGILTLTMDDPTSSVNTMNDAFRTSLHNTITKLTTAVDDGHVTGVILTSAKKTFFAGGDITSMITAGPEDAQSTYNMITDMKRDLRTLETLGIPVVAAINGAALGGGLEIALSCHHRIASKEKSTRLGLPEVTLGLLPGGGGVARTVRMLGIQEALMSVLTTGKQMRPDAAKELGLIDDVVAPDNLITAAREWLASNPDPIQPWDKKGYRIPGGTPTTPKLASILPSFPATVTKQIKGAPMPAPKAILAAAVEGAQVDFDHALDIESRYFVELVTGPTSTNMMQAFFFDLHHCNGGGSRPRSVEKKQFTKLGMVGAGMMGAGIAYVAAKAGMEVALKDVELANAERGKAYSEDLEKKALERGRTTPEQSQALLDRITPTADYADLADCDIVIEAVFENTELKHKVWAEIEEAVPHDCLLGSNTSTLPITGLADGVTRPNKFIGIHFFSPVDKMPLIEVIKGEKTDDDTLAGALDFSKQIHKTPIVVNDSRGFYTSRVIGFMLDESLRMLAEGIDPAVIEAAGRQAGYPAPPLQLTDELNLKLVRKINTENAKAAEAAGITIDDGGVTTIVNAMLDDYDRPGKLEGRGFYEYTDGKRTGLWEGLWSKLGAGTVSIGDYESKVSHTDHRGQRRDAPNTPSANAPTFADLRERILFAEALETQKCVDEGVLMDDADANIGSIMGIGFPAWTGGTRQYIKNYVRPADADLPATADDDYPTRGIPGFVARARELAAKYGQRFEPMESLTS